MTQTVNYQQMETADRSQAHTLFAQTMGYVAATAGLFALGAWLGRNLTGGVGIVAFIAGFGAAGYATRRDMTPVARAAFWALVALIVFGIISIVVNIPGDLLVYSVLGLVIFAGFTMFDFQRLRHSTDTTTAPLLAASIFLDVLNVFLFFLAIFSGEETR
jgi:FtsH-binding integral membrane protein